jgi:hypothetical protein
MEIARTLLNAVLLGTVLTLLLLDTLDTLVEVVLGTVALSRVSALCCSSGQH